MNCCVGCNKYEKWQPHDYCCQKCAQVSKMYGYNKTDEHGNSCKRILCQTGCINMKTKKPLYGNNTICFYEKNQPYYEFTNFYFAEIIVNDVTYKTSEHFYQSQKFVNNETIWKLVVNADTPRKAFEIAQKYSNYIVSNWRQINVDVMRYAIFYKFTQHPDLKSLLLNTNNKDLVEHTDKDNFWGDGGDGSGSNMLGKLLMGLRYYLSI